MKKKLYKDKSRGKIFGVCAGFADYFEVDAALVRILWLISLFCFGWGFLGYIICALVMEDKSLVLPGGSDEKSEDEGEKKNKDGSESKTKCTGRSDLLKILGIAALVIFALPTFLIVFIVIYSVFAATSFALSALPFVPFRRFFPLRFFEYAKNGLFFRGGSLNFAIIAGLFLLSIGFCILFVWAVCAVVSFFRGRRK